MPWEAWVVVALMAASALVTVASIGKPRTPTTHGTAIIVLIINAILILLVVEASCR